MKTDIKYVYMVEFYYQSSIFEKNIYETYIYLSYNQAFDCVKMIVEKESEGDINNYENYEEFIKWKILITKKIVDCKDIENYDWDNEEEWLYDILGNQIYHSKSNQIVKKNKQRKSKKIKIGDIVKIIPFPYCNFSQIPIFVNGIIAQINEDREECIVNIYDEARCRFFHEHMNKDCIEILNDSNMKHYKEFKIISNILQGKIKTNDDFIEKLENGQISICEIKKLKHRV